MVIEDAATGVDVLTWKVINDINVTPKGCYIVSHRNTKSLSAA